MVQREANRCSRSASYRGTSTNFCVGGQMTPFEFVIIFLIGGVITVGQVHQFVAYLRSRFPRFGAWADGAPMVLLKGRLLLPRCDGGLGIDPEGVMAAGREQGVTSLAQIKYAVVERNGSISIIKR